jgi:hypothetical protein
MHMQHCCTHESKGTTMGRKGARGYSLTDAIANLGAPKKGKGKGSKPVQLGGSTSGFAKRDTGGTAAKRQTQKNHGTNRRGGGYRG